MADTPNTPANDPAATPRNIKNFKEIEKIVKENIKSEHKDIKELKLEKVETKEHKDAKHEKLGKNETKEHKDAKHEKLEKNEIKEHKDSKVEKSEKNEIKEHKDGAKIEHKENLKIENLEKQIGKEKDGKEIVETQNGNPVIDPVDQRITAVEQNVASLQHFITTGQRPDLSRGALTGEPGSG